MKKALISVSVVVFVILFAVSNFSFVSAALPPLPPGTYIDHVNAYGEAVVDIAGHPKIVFEGYHFDYGDLGAGDVFRILLPVIAPIGATVYLPVAIFTDIPGRFSLFQRIYGFSPTSVQLVDSSDIEVRREGKSKTIMVIWKTTLEVPAEEWPEGSVPAITIPPGRLIFRGHGYAISGSQSAGGTGWTQTFTWTGYYGNSTFVCPTLDFGGPVGVNAGEYRTNIRLDATITTTILRPPKL